MRSFFSFGGRMRPLAYAASSVAALFSQHLVVLAVVVSRGERPVRDWGFWLVPLRSLVTHAREYDPMLVVGLAWMLVVAWALAALAFRRAADAGISEWIAAAAMVPLVQIPVILGLAAAPSRQADPPPASGEASTARDRWAAAMQGMVAGLGLTLFAVAVSTLVFGVYGFGLFVLSPVVIGAVTAYLANRRHDIGGARTASVVAAATALGGIGLIAAALEGLFCIVLAAPLGFGAAMIGGMLGRAVAVSTRRTTTQSFAGVALLPMVFALEHALPATTTFDTEQTIAVDAPPAAVWAAIVRMDTIAEPPALPFRFGLAYPLRGEILGEGVGALRRGEFSTGTAVEQVTAWVPERKLAFVVVDDVPSMHELSPYRHVHAPHAVGYFRTASTSFELVKRPDGGTRIVERTSHELKLEPILYWLPMARWAVDQNNARVLAHIRRQAEGRLADR